MLKFIFYNSYQGSYTGFQNGYYSVGLQRIERITKEYPAVCEIRELLSNSGCTCALGKSSDGQKNYFVLRGVNLIDEEDREWFINFGIETDKDSYERFKNLVCNILVNYVGFLNSIKNWFVATPTDDLSYNLNYDNVDGYISSCVWINPDDFEYYHSDDGRTKLFKRMILELKNNNYTEVLLLVPEITLDYFLHQSSFFKNVHKRYVIGSETFKELINKTTPTSDTQEDQVNDSNVAEGKKGSSSEVNRFSVTDEELQKIKIGLLIGAGLATVVGIGVCVNKLKKLF